VRIQHLHFLIEPIFRTFFLGEILGKIPWKIFPQKTLGKNVFFCGKSFEIFFLKKFHRIFRGKSLSAEKNVQKIGRRDSISRTEISKTIPLDHAPKAQFF
jgi:hypothetical protein